MITIKVDPQVLGDIAAECGVGCVLGPDNYQEWRRDYVKFTVTVQVGGGRIQFWASVPTKHATKPPIVPSEEMKALESV